MLRIIPVDVTVRFDDLAPIPACPDWLLSGAMDVEAWTDGLAVHSWSIGAIRVSTGLDLETAPGGVLSDDTPVGAPAREVTAASHPGLHPLIRQALIGHWREAVVAAVLDLGIEPDRRPMARRAYRTVRAKAAA